MSSRVGAPAPRAFRAFRRRDFHDYGCLGVNQVSHHDVNMREYGDQNTEISCGGEDTFAVRLSPAQAVAALGVAVR